MAIIGITFDNQGPTAKDHGALFSGILSDGIIKGCGLSTSGADLTIAAGYIIAAGRLMRLAAAQTITISATSGYARVLAQINLAEAATSTEFAQATFVTQTAESISGFAALTQEDINGSGIIYQAELCVVECDANGIAGIVSQSGTAGRIVLSNVSVAASAFTADATYTDFPYAAAIACAGVTADMFAEVVLSPTDALGGNYAPVCLTGAGTVTIYAAAVPSAALTIPTIHAGR